MTSGLLPLQLLLEGEDAKVINRNFEILSLHTPRIILAESDQTVATSTLTDDTELSFLLVAGSCYVVKLFLSMNILGGSSGFDAKIFAVQVDESLSGAGHWVANVGGSFVDAGPVLSRATISNESAASTYTVFVLDSAAVDNDIRLQFASKDSGSVTRNSGSFMEVTKIR